MNSILFYQKVREETTCPVCAGYLNMMFKNGKLYQTCLSCGYEQECKKERNEDE